MLVAFRLFVFVVYGMIIYYVYDICSCPFLFIFFYLCDIILFSALLFDLLFVALFYFIICMCCYVVASRLFSCMCFLCLLLFYIILLYHLSASFM